MEGFLSDKPGAKVNFETVLTFTKNIILFIKIDKLVSKNSSHEALFTESCILVGLRQ